MINDELRMMKDNRSMGQEVNRLKTFLSFCLFTFSPICPLSLLFTDSVWAQGIKKAGELDEVIIKGEEIQKPSIPKPPLKIAIDPYETIRDSFKPDESLFLAEDPQLFSFKKTYPELLYEKRVIQPSRNLIREPVSFRFNLAEKLSEILGRTVSDKEAKNFQWIFTIVDEQGNSFHRMEGKNQPPEELHWNGQNEKGEWVRAGTAYSSLYEFRDRQGALYSGAGSPMRFKGMAHQTDQGTFLSLDSSILFGPEKRSKEILKPEGESLLLAACDWIKRWHKGVALRVRTASHDLSLARAQSERIREFLSSELKILPDRIAIESSVVPFSNQIVELILLKQ